MRVVDVEAVVAPIRAQITGSGFLSRYVRWAVTQTDAPEQFHVMVGLSLLSAVMSPGARAAFGSQRVKPNLYCMVVGTSGTERKTASMSVGRRLLSQAAPKSLGSRFGSYEAILDELVERPQCLILEPEFSRFLSQAGKGSHLQAVKTGLTDLFDGEPISNRTRKHGAMAVHDDYRLSMLAAVSDSYLAQFTEPSDFTGGFMSRWLFTHADRNRWLYQPMDTPETRKQQEELVKHLEMLYQYSPPGVYRITPDSEADQLYYHWSQELNRTAVEAEFKVRGTYMRAQMMTLRVAGLLAMDRVAQDPSNHVLDSLGVRDLMAQPEDHVFEITTEDLLPAMHIVSTHLASVQRIVRLVAHTESDRQKARVLDALPEPKPGEEFGEFLPLGAITKTAGMLSKQAKEVLGTLETEGRVQALSLSNNQLRYARVAPRTTGETRRVDGLDVASTSEPLPEAVTLVPPAEARPEVYGWQYKPEDVAPAAPAATPARSVAPPDNPWYED